MPSVIHQSVNGRSIRVVTEANGDVYVNGKLLPEEFTKSPEQSKADRLALCCGVLVIGVMLGFFGCIILLEHFGRL